jgi:eukaryotic-like serine/threonine-protein kinase
MRVFRRIATIGVAVAATCAMVTGVSAAAPTADTGDRAGRTCVNTKGLKKIYLETWKQAPTYCLPDVKNRWGWLNAGKEYFYCQKNWNIRVTDGKWTNTWWALTDDDTGNVGVWVSVVYIKGGKNDQRHPKLPDCK